MMVSIGLNSRWFLHTSYPGRLHDFWALRGTPVRTRTSEGSPFPDVFLSALLRSNHKPRQRPLESHPACKKQHFSYKDTKVTPGYLLLNSWYILSAACCFWECLFRHWHHVWVYSTTIPKSPQQQSVQDYIYRCPVCWEMGVPWYLQDFLRIFFYDIEGRVSDKTDQIGWSGEVAVSKNCSGPKRGSTREDIGRGESHVSSRYGRTYWICSDQHVIATSSGSVLFTWCKVAIALNSLN